MNCISDFHFTAIYFQGPIPVGKVIILIVDKVLVSQNQIQISYFSTYRRRKTLQTPLIAYIRYISMKYMFLDSFRMKNVFLEKKNNDFHPDPPWSRPVLVYKISAKTQNINEKKHDKMV